jgi:repressor LexA
MTEQPSNTLQVEEQLRKKRTEIFEALYSAALAVNSSLDLEDIFSQIFHQMLLLSGDRGQYIGLASIFLVEKEQLQLVATYPRAMLGNLRSQGMDSLHLGNTGSPIGITGRAIRTGGSQLVADVSNDPDYIVANHDTRSELAVPMKIRDNVMGVINIEYLDHNAFDLDDQYAMEAIEALAAQAAVAIENARRYQHSERQSRQLAILNRIGRILASSLDLERLPALIIEQVSELLNVEEGSLLLADEATGELVFAYTTGPFGQRLLGQRIPRGAGLAGYVVEHGQSMIVNDAQHNQRFDNRTESSTGFVTRSLLAVPVRSGVGVQGVIEVLNPHNGGYFTSEDQEVLEVLADHVVIALENAQRFAQLNKELVARTQTLLRTTAALLRASVTSVVDAPTAAIQQILVEAGTRQAEVLRRCAIPRWFDLGVLAVLRERDDGNERVLELMRKYSFVRRLDAQRYAYHDEVRAAIHAEWREQQPNNLSMLSTRLAEYFEHLVADAEQNNLITSYESDLWRHEALYHRLMADLETGMAQLETAFLDAKAVHNLAEAEALLQIMDDAALDWIDRLQIDRLWEHLEDMQQQPRGERVSSTGQFNPDTDQRQKQGNDATNLQASDVSHIRSTHRKLRSKPLGRLDEPQEAPRRLNEPTHPVGFRSPDALSNRQKGILDYIEDFVQDHGYPPAIRQIQEKLDISSTSVVRYSLKALEAKGLIKREGKVSRGITMSDATPINGSRRRGALVPLLGVITAGSPLPGPEEIVSQAAETIEVPADLAPPERLRDVYALRVRGQSMIDAFIDDGDIVLLRYQETAENGQMVVVRLNDENAVTIKKFYREGNRVKLQPANSTMEPIFVDATNVSIQGCVVGVLRQML